MVPELPNEVWMLVLENLEDVLDWGRVQQVSNAFQAIIADICWSRIKNIEMRPAHFNAEDKFGLDDHLLVLSVQKQLLLLKMLAKQAPNITKITLVTRCARLTDEHTQFLKGALDILANASQKIQSFNFEGDFIMLTPVFPSLSWFLRTKAPTIQELSIDDFCSEVHQIPSELLEAIQNCSNLESATLDQYRHLNGPLLESILSGKVKLKRLTIVTVDDPSSVILDSGIQLVELSCNTAILDKYAMELVHRGLAAADAHPLLTVKALSIKYGFIPSLSMLPNLEHLKRGLSWEMDPVSVVSGFLNDFKDAAGTQKMLRCHMLRGVDDGQSLALRVETAVPCRAMVKVLADGSTEIACFCGNAVIILDFPHAMDSSYEESRVLCREQHRLRNWV